MASLVNDKKDVFALNQLMQNANFRTYLIDKEQCPESTFQFVVDASITNIKQFLIFHNISYNPSLHHSRDGYIQVTGSLKNSFVYITSLKALTITTIREEFLIALQRNWAPQWLCTLRNNGLLNIFFPELAATVNIDGGPYHQETVFEHLIAALKSAYTYSPRLKLAVLLHDIGKPATSEVRKAKDGNWSISFHKHDIVGASIAYTFCKRLGLEPEDTQYIVKLVRHHMFHFDIAKDKTIKKWLYKVGKDGWTDLFLLRMADRRGNKANNKKPAFTLKMRKLQAQIERIIETTEAVFQTDLKLSKKEIQAFNNKNYDINQIYTNLIGLVNYDKDRNTQIWLADFMRKVYS